MSSRPFHTFPAFCRLPVIFGKPLTDLKTAQASLRQKKISRPWYLVAAPMFYCEGSSDGRAFFLHMPGISDPLSLCVQASTGEYKTRHDAQSRALHTFPVLV